jgi:hypothetical protein
MPEGYYNPSASNIQSEKGSEIPKTDEGEHFNSSGQDDDTELTPYPVSGFPHNYYPYFYSMQGIPSIIPNGYAQTYPYVNPFPFYYNEGNGTADEAIQAYNVLTERQDNAEEVAALTDALIKDLNIGSSAETDNLNSGKRHYEHGDSTPGPAKHSNKSRRGRRNRDVRGDGRANSNQSMQTLPRRG